MKICQYLGLYIRNNMPKVSHYNTFRFLRYAHPRHEKCLFTNILKQRNMLKISLIFTKNTNWTGITSTCFPHFSFSPPLSEILSSPSFYWSPLQNAKKVFPPFWNFQTSVVWMSIWWHNCKKEYTLK